MKTLDRYIGRTVVLNTLLVLFVVTALLSVFSLIRQLDDVGRGNYDLITAIYYVVLNTPTSVYRMFAFCVLIGCLLGMGAMAGHSELIVMRAAGISVKRIVLSTLKSGFLLMVLVALMGEFVVPPAERYAQSLRLEALSQKVSVNSRHGLWARDDKRFINVRTVMPDLRLRDITVYHYKETGRIDYAVHIDMAKQNSDGSWLMDNVVYSRFAYQAVTREEVGQEVWPELINPELLRSLSVDPETLSTRELIDHIEYLDGNQLDSERYKLAFWIKIATPISSLVMLVLSMPFVFGSLRSTGSGGRIFMGILLGLGFVLVNELITRLGLVYGMPAVLSAFLPVTGFGVLAFIGLRRVL